MASRHTSNEEGWKALIRPVLIGAAVGIAVTLALLLVCAFVFTLRDIPESAALPVSSVAAGLGALCGGFASARMVRKQGMMIGAITGAIIFIVTVAASIIADSGAFTANTPIRLLIMVLASVIGGILGVNYGAKRKMI
jgi:putative membrane protein (TIGR04086 family)